MPSTHCFAQAFQLGEISSSRPATHINEREYQAVRTTGFPQEVSASATRYDRQFSSGYPFNTARALAVEHEVVLPLHSGSYVASTIRPKLGPDIDMEQDISVSITIRPGVSISERTTKQDRNLLRRYSRPLDTSWVTCGHCVVRERERQVTRR